VRGPRFTPTVVYVRAAWGSVLGKIGTKTIAESGQRIARGRQGKAHSEKARQDSSTALTIEFGNHISVLRDIEKLSEEELRPVDLQVIYILKRYLDTRKVSN